MCELDKKCGPCAIKNKLQESKKLNEFINFADPKAVAQEKKEFSRIKDLDVVRPSKMAPAPVDNLPTRSYATKACDLYVQDEANDIFVDKSGFERGYKNWRGTIDAGGGVMFQAANSIANQKWVMCKALGIEDKLRQDYFFRSYLDIWKQWSGKSGAPTIKKQAVTKTTPTFTKAAKPVISKTPKFTAKFTTVTPNSKDEMRMNDLLISSNPYGQASKMVSVTNDIDKLIGRGKTLASRGKQSLADLFFYKAKKLLGESKISFVDKVLLEARIK